MARFLPFELSGSNATEGITMNIRELITHGGSLLFAPVCVGVCIAALLGPSFGSPVMSIPGALDAEAEDAADTFVLAHFNLDCGPAAFSKDDRRYSQYKSLTWSLQPDALTHKDVVFGIQWRGHLEIHAAMYRTYVRAAGLSRQTHWSAWRPLEPIRFYVQKKNGIWNFHSTTAYDEPVIGDAPTCEEVPDFTW